jgi:ketosteroid isomerase-like protein
MDAAESICERYLDAWTAGDFDKARSLLHDDLAFRGPFEEFTCADGLVPSMRRAGSQLLRSVENKHVFADGAEVVITCDFVAPDPVG